MNEVLSRILTENVRFQPKSDDYLAVGDKWGAKTGELEYIQDRSWQVNI